MSWSLVQSASARVTTSGGQTTVTATFGSAVTAGDLITVQVVNYSSGGMSVQDNINGAAYAQGILAGSTASQAGIYWYVPPIGGSSFAVTLTTSGNTPGAIIIREWSGPAGTIAVTGTPTGAVASNVVSIASSPISVTGPALAIACVADVAAITGITPGTGWTLGTNVAWNNNVNVGIVDEYILNQSTGSITPSMSWGVTSSSSAIAAMAFFTGSSALFSGTPFDGLGAGGPFFGNPLSHI